MIFTDGGHIFKFTPTKRPVADPGFFTGGGWLNGGGQMVAKRPRTAIGRAGGYRPPVWKRGGCPLRPLNPPLEQTQVHDTRSSMVTHPSTNGDDMRCLNFCLSDFTCRSNQRLKLVRQTGEKVRYHEGELDLPLYNNTNIIYIIHALSWSNTHSTHYDSACIWLDMLSNNWYIWVLQTNRLYWESLCHRFKVQCWLIRWRQSRGKCHVVVLLHGYWLASCSVLPSHSILIRMDYKRTTDAIALACSCVPTKVCWVLQLHLFSVVEVTNCSKWQIEWSPGVVAWRVASSVILFNKTSSSSYVCILLSCYYILWLTHFQLFSMENKWKSHEMRWIEYKHFFVKFR